MERLCLAGTVDGAAQVRTSDKGTAYATLKLAVKRSFTGRDGQAKTFTSYYGVKVFSPQMIEQVRHLPAGSLITVEGRPEARGYTGNDGSIKGAIDVVVNGFDSQLAVLHQSGASAHAQAKGNAYQPSKDLDDEIPF